MKERIELTDHESWTLLNKGNLVSIPKKKKHRHFLPPEGAKRIEYVMYPSHVYLRDGKKWYRIKEDDVPNDIRKDFLDGR